MSRVQHRGHSATELTWELYFVNTEAQFGLFVVLIAVEATDPIFAAVSHDRALLDQVERIAELT